MKHSTTMLVSLLLALAMMTALLSGCGETPSASDNSSSAPVESAEFSGTETPAPAEESPSAEEPIASAEESANAPAPQEEEALLNKSTGIETREGGTDAYPIDATDTLTMLMPYAGMTPDILPSNQDNLVLTLAEERTGIHVEYKDISQSAYEEQLALLIASGDLTDMICNLAQNYTSGVDAAIEDDVIVDLAEYREYAPNYFYIIDNSDLIQKDTATDSGAVGGFYKLQAAMAAPKSGIHIRQDWLSDLGLENPVTVDDYTEVFEAFKNAYNPETVVWIEDTTASIFAYAYDVIGGYTDVFFQENGTVKYSPIEDSYRDYLTQLRSWYEAGYINKDFISLDSSAMGTSDMTAAIGAGEVGVWSGFADTPAQIASSVDGYTVTEAFKAIQNPVLAEGNTLHLGTVMDVVDSGSSSISAKCSNIPLAMQWFDYWYSEEGSILYTYGEENTTFYWNDDHQAMFTDLITDNPNYPAFFMQMAYLQDSSFGLLSAYREGCIYGYDSDIVKTPMIWLSDNYDGAYILSNKLSMTLDESERYSSKYLDIETYVSENIAQFVTGARSLDDYDNFVDTIKSMGIEEVLAIKQAAYDRYIER